jgi:hypothetical protein
MHIWKGGCPHDQPGATTPYVGEAADPHLWGVAAPHLQGVVPLKGGGMTNPYMGGVADPHLWGVAAPHLQGVVPLKGGGTADPYMVRVPSPKCEGWRPPHFFLFDVDMSFINNVAFLIDVALMCIVWCGNNASWFIDYATCHAERGVDIEV